MPTEKVILFRSYPLEAGLRIRIDSGPRAGDWEVVSADKSKVKLRCPISGKEYEWDRFVYFVGEDSEAEWPQKEQS